MNSPRFALRLFRSSLSQMGRLEAELKVMKDCWKLNRPEEVGQRGEWLGMWEGVSERVVLTDPNKNDEGDEPSLAVKRKRRRSAEPTAAKLKFTAVGEVGGGLSDAVAMPSFVSPLAGAFFRPN